MDGDLDSSLMLTQDKNNRRASTSSDLGAGGAPDEEDHIRVVCRVRPPQPREGRSALGLRTCVSVGEGAKTVTLKQASGPKVFTFDHAVGPDGTQESLFQLAGKPATRACIQGYNGTVFCYGQTGSGKTYTMFGPNVDCCDSDDEHRGMVPRVLEYLFAHVAREERRNGGAVTYLCRCSFYEIFNERVFDLLDSDSGCSMGGLQTREDMKKGVYVEGLTEEAVDSPHQAYQVLTRGYRNRHVGETAMNRESSRSHAVFTVVLESREVDTVDGITRARCASFNLVDLAGSERQSQSGASGERLKEASSINKSLSALGNVINALVSGRTRYVPYRDSRLTFLLRDSLGGNAKTFLVACTSPNDENFAETLSTLKFAQRAKMIKNKAVVNENTSGTVEALQKQLRTLRQELLTARAVINASGGTLPPSLSSDAAAAAAAGGALVPAGNVKSSAEYRRTEALLKETLERSLRIEQARDLAEKMAGNVQATVDRLEQNLLHERMVRKMKESQIQRHLKKAGATVEGSTEEELRAEVDALRKELEQVPAEAIKWRAAAENAQAQLDALLDKEEGLGMWVEDREKTFATSLEEQLKACLQDKAELEARMEEGGGGGGGGGGGRPKGSKRLSDGGMNRLREVETKATHLEEELVTAKRLAEDCEAQLAEARAQAAQAVSTQSQLQVKVTLAERRLEILEGENKVLKADRDFNLALLQERIDNTQVEAQAAKQDVETQLAAACKDNAILLQRLKETATEADAVAARHAAAEMQLRALTEELEEQLRPKLASLESELAANQAALAESRREMESKAEEMDRTVAQFQEAMQALEAKHEADAAQLRTALDEEAGRTQALRAEKEEAAFLLANLQEDHDTLTQLMEFTQGKNADLEQAMAAALAEAEALGKERTRLEGAWEDAKAQVAELENQLDKAGGDAAEESKALRTLEGANQELQQERTALLETVEGLRAELAGSEAAQEQASKEAARASQVLADLGEQVGRLRGELAEARTKEQAARAEADGLSQEREDLLQRATEAEDSQAEMGEEMMAYLDEITMLKTRAHETERVHGEKLRELEAAHKVAEKEAGEKAHQIQALESELQGLKERLKQQEAADYDAKAAMEAELAKQLQESEWAHTQAVADLRQNLAEAAARGAEAARYKMALGNSQSEAEALRASLQEREAALDAARTQGTAAEERCKSLAQQLGEALARERDAADWKEEKVRWEAEVVQAREMEKEAFERCEDAEQGAAKLAQDVKALEQELEELKGVNVKLVGHANSRQKIQLHSKLKEELTDLSKRCKALEEENYALKKGSSSSAGSSSGAKSSSSSSSSSTKSSNSKAVAASSSSSSSSENAPPLGNLTNVTTKRAARPIVKKKAVGLEALAADGDEEMDT